MGEIGPDLVEWMVADDLVSMEKQIRWNLWWQTIW
jgi:hypothetical protein